MKFTNGTDIADVTWRKYGERGDRQVFDVYADGVWIGRVERGEHPVHRKHGRIIYSTSYRTGWQVWAPPGERPSRIYFDTRHEATARVLDKFTDERWERA